MPKYSREPRAGKAKTAKAQGRDLRVHFKNTREAASVLRGMRLTDAKQLMEDVLARKRCVPYRRYASGTGRCSQAKEWGVTKGRWPKKSIEHLLGLLKNAEANAELKSLEPGKLFVTHAQVNRARKQRRRTYRAHGRIGPYMASCAHVEMILTQRELAVKTPPAATA